MKIGLFDYAGIEVSYPGYQRMDAEWDVAQGVASNIDEIRFPATPDHWTGSASVYAARVFNGVTMVAHVPLSANLGLSAGITVSFMPGNLQVPESMLTRAAVDKVLNGLWPKLPTNCKKCNHYNEYVGPEHLTNGEYICRSCR